jgi:membrane fusion protein (multidrug efflux system)
MTASAPTHDRAPAAPGADPVPPGATDAAPAEAAKGSRKKVVIGAVVAATVALGGTGYWLYERQFEDTDDAQIDANISNVSPRVSGTVTAVRVVENQQVKAGDVLAEIDPGDLKVAVQLAKAQVAEADAQLRAEDPSVSMTETTNKTTVATSGSDIASASAGVAQARKSLDQLASQLTQAEASDRDAQLERKRAKQLIDQRAIPQAEYDKAVAAAEASAAHVEGIRHALEAGNAGVGEQEARLATTRSRLAEAKANAPRQLETRQAAVLWRQASLDAAKAQLAQAELNLSYAKVVSPIDGIVGKKAVALGDHVAPGQEIIAVVQTADVWVTANFRETQLTKMHPGLGVTVHVDAIDADLHGVVDSIGGATGSRYSVLPPENASGNYVKVVQRIPVRIRFDPHGQAGRERLRPGMSVEPKVRL